MFKETLVPAKRLVKISHQKAVKNIINRIKKNHKPS
jgi:hypothetical protein